MKKCNKCNKTKLLSEFHKSYTGNYKQEVVGQCKMCRAEYSREHYKKNKKEILRKQRTYLQTEKGKANKLRNAYRMKKKYPKKWKTRWTANNAVRLGKIRMGKCEVCGHTKPEIHHDDYDKPLQIRWFCMEHHKEYERRENIK